MLLFLYRLVARWGKPLLLRKLRRRGVAEPLYLHAVHQRFGMYDSEEQQRAGTHAGHWVWVHAVSLGETRAAAILVQAMRQRCPGLPLLLTSGTATGWAEAEKLLRPGDTHVWLPWDSREATHHFIRLFRPKAGLLMETEVWPELLRTCAEAHVPVALVNARMSEKTLRQSLRLRALAFPAYGSLQAVYAQTPQDAGRLRQLQARHVQVTGNLKFDATPDEHLLAQGRQWRQQLQTGDARPVAMLASSREGEEALWLQALQQLAAPQRHSLQWLLVPRHPQRFDEIEAFCRQQGWQVLRRSHWGRAAAGQVGAPVLWLGDSMGEMPLYYAMADVVLMGGSFAPLGGQNLIEACACGCPVLLGPHTFNFAEASENAIAAGAARRCASMEEAVQQALQLLQPLTTTNAEAALPAMRQAALAFSQQHRGAADRVVLDMLQRGWLEQGAPACGQPWPARQQGS